MLGQNRKFTLAMTAACTLVCGPAVAADADGRFAVKGAGNVSCAQFLDDKKQVGSVYRNALGWIAGYVSAYNRFAAETFDILPWQDGPPFVNAVAVFCAQNPNVTLQSVVDDFLVSLAPQRLSEISLARTIALPGGEATLYEATWARVLDQLVARELLAAADRGKPEAIGAALSELQRRAGHEATGLPDPATLSELLIPENERRP